MSQTSSHSGCNTYTSKHTLMLQPLTNNDNGHPVAGNKKWNLPIRKYH
jgi:hypothetical protein